jgi:hypothetical protein
MCWHVERMGLMASVFIKNRSNRFTINGEVIYVDNDGNVIGDME